jgi:hypothetical protein
MTEPQEHWTQAELKTILELGPIAELEKLIAEPGRKYRQEFAHDYTISALRNLTQSDVLPDDIRALVVRILELHEKASSPFLGMNLPATKKDEA